jgi:hypothetical protein
VCTELQLLKVLVFLVWRIIHEQSLYPYHNQQVQVLTPLDNHARVVGVLPMASCRICCKHKVCSQHHVYWWGTIHKRWYCELSQYPCLGDGSPHTIVASRRQHRLSINVWVGILGDELLGPVVLPNRLTSAVYHCFVVNDLLVLL